MTRNTRKQWLWRSLYGCLCLGAAALAVACGWAQAARRELDENVLRLHITANSDGAWDQAVKLQVRDRVLRDCGWLFGGCRSAQEAAQRARDSAGLIRRAAQAELRRQGSLAQVTVTVERCAFPTKDYGGVRLPAGTYTALNLRIGAAAGHNWWCVLYPPLCLTQGAVQADPETLRLLRSSLTPQEYALVTQSQELHVRMRFKLIELLGQRP